MKDEKTAECCQDKMTVNKCHCHHHGGTESGALYGFGMTGALFYFLHNAITFGVVMLGIGKAIFWPALVVFRILGMLEI